MNLGETMKYTHIIWDFNGTLLDDVDACIRAVNKLLRERSLKTLDTKEEYRRIFKFPIRDYYRDVGFDFEKEPYEVLAPLWMELYYEYTKELTLCAGAREALEYFKEAGLRQIILSASERGLLLRQLDQLGIADYYKFFPNNLIGFLKSVSFPHIFPYNQKYSTYFVQLGIIHLGIDSNFEFLKIIYLKNRNHFL